MGLFNIDLNTAPIDEALLMQDEEVIVDPATLVTKTEPKKDESKKDEKKEPEDTATIDEATLISDSGEEEQEVSGDKQVEAIKATAKYLQSIGGFENIPDDFDGTSEGLVELIQGEALNKAKNFVESREAALPEQIKDLIEAWDEHGDAAFNDIFETRVKQMKYSSITEDTLKENTSMQKDLYRNFLKNTTKFSEAKITKMINAAEEDLTLESLVIEEALPELIKGEKEKEEEIKIQSKEAQVQAQKDYQATLKTYKDTIDKTDEVLGIKLSKKDKEEMFNLMTKPIGKDKQGNPIFYNQAVSNQDPVAYNIAVTTLLMKTKGLKEKDGFLKSAATVATKQLDKKLEKSNVKKQTGSADYMEETEDKDISKAFYETFTNLNINNKK